MSNSNIAVSLRVTKFLADFFQEYIRNNRFSRYIGTTNNSVIVIKEGKQIINIPLLTRLKSRGVSGNTTLEGNEESVSNYSMNVTPTYHRNAVRLTKEEKDKPAFDLMKAARPLLMDWSKEYIRDDIIQAMNQMIVGSSALNYGGATEDIPESSAANKDTWNLNNQDRILYGKSKSNLVPGDNTASLATIDTTDDKFSPEIAMLAKRMAKAAKPHIRPLKVNDDEEWFIAFCDPFAFRDLKTSATMTEANREARERSVNNPLFTDGDLVYDGIIFREVPEIADFIDGDNSAGTNGVWGGLLSADGLNTAGNGGTRVGVVFLCGQQAVAYGLGQRANMETQEFDYKFQPGVAVEMKHQILKANFNGKQHGMVTIFVSSARDA